VIIATLEKATTCQLHNDPKCKRIGYMNAAQSSSETESASDTCSIKHGDKKGII
jgi:hypothetical protein